MKISIPKENNDIRITVTLRLVMQIVFCAAWTAIISTLMLISVYDYFCNALGILNAVLIWVILCLIPFWMCKFWRWFTDRPYEGQVISCKQTSSVAARGIAKKEYLMRTYTQNINIKLPNGKKKTVKVTWFSDKEVPFYYEGNYVRHYRGTKYMQVISDDPGAPRICVMCGTQNRSEETVCMICGKTLIDNSK